MKKPHTEVIQFKIAGHIDRKILEYLSERFGKDNVSVDKSVVDIMESDWYRDMSVKTTPGTVVRIYRENFGPSQKELAQKAGVSKASYISDIEHGRRPVSKNLAKKFAQIFSLAPEFFLD